MSAKLSKALRGLIYARNLDKGLIDALSEIGEKDNNPSHDRALAIIGAVYIEDALRNAITKHLMPYRSDQVQSQIFTDDQAPLSGFAARTRMASALGIIVDPIRKDLGLIRGIRNAFAHSPGEITFNTPAVRDAVESLTALESLPLQEVIDGVGADRALRARFIVAVGSICNLIDKHDGCWGPSSFWKEVIEQRAASRGKQPQPHPQDQKSRDGTPPTPARPPRSSRT